VPYRAVLYRGFHITFDERFPKFVRKFRISRRTWQFDQVVSNLVTNFATRLGTTLRTSLEFRELKLDGPVLDRLDQKTYDFILQTLVTNQFTSRLQLKLLTSEQLDYMFSKNLALGAKALLVHHVDLLKDKSPLPTRTKERRKEVHGNETSTATESRRVSLTCSTTLHVVTGVQSAYIVTYNVRVYRAL